ncbi:HNH endonuclease family protein [[Mycobacterium] vasticus]|uniref:HNH endonuclease family protein n=1 Tax=[Mycobacterium] vasticus TaxID=2875777 RepID=A0ABU5Z332_9MYCO|nr:HNH endonuclease family protein [Mycolicibacter sp. MYC017]MEB3071816.1 HNH endonuclease family protein [Mycolicibacter sp. MYC017]
MRSLRGSGVIVLIVAAFLGWAWWNNRPQRSEGPTPAWTPTAPLDPGYDAARRKLDALPVKGWDRLQDFKRYRFGERWSDDVDVEFGHNGCNTRDDILRRDLTQVELRRGTCLVQRGVLHDPYSGETIEFVRGPETSETVQVDHVVALADAWYKGAQSWDDARRRDFANDPRNLLATGAQANFDKAFRDAAGWLPANAAFECDFVARQVEVKTVYGLWVSSNEKTAMRRVLRNC